MKKIIPTPLARYLCSRYELGLKAKQPAGQVRRATIRYIVYNLDRGGLTQGMPRSPIVKNDFGEDFEEDCRGLAYLLALTGIRELHCIYIQDTLSLRARLA